MDAMHYRLAEPADARAIGILARRVVRRWVLPEQPLRAAPHLLAILGARAIRERMRIGYRYHLAFVDGVLVGVAATRDNSHLFNFFVSTRYHGRGIGRRLWQRVMADAVRRAGTTHFTVNSSDCAVLVYLRLGFVRNGPPHTSPNGVIATPMRYERETATPGHLRP